MPAISHGDVRIHYALSGCEGGELLVLSNSLGSSLRMWNKVLPRLEAAYRILLYDTRGHGCSSDPPGPYTLDQLGRDVVHLLDELGAERVNFCGLSLGGLVGMWLAVHAPERVNRVVLANTAARIGSEEMWDERVAAVHNSGMDALAKATPARWFTPQFREKHAEEMEQVKRMIALTAANGYSSCCAVLREADLSACLSAIAVPTLVIAGTHDLATPASKGRALAAAIPGARYVELNASHLSAWECADEFADAVLAFLAGGGQTNG